VVVFTHFVLWVLLPFPTSITCPHKQTNDSGFLSLLASYRRSTKEMESTISMTIPTTQFQSRSVRLIKKDLSFIYLLLFLAMCCCSCCCCCCCCCCFSSLALSPLFYVPPLSVSLSSLSTKLPALSLTLSLSSLLPKLPSFSLTSLFPQKSNPKSFSHPSSSWPQNKYTPSLPPSLPPSPSPKTHLISVVLFSHVPLFPRPFYISKSTHTQTVRQTDRQGGREGTGH